MAYYPGAQNPTTAQSSKVSDLALSDYASTTSGNTKSADGGAGKWRGAGLILTVKGVWFGVYGVSCAFYMCRSYADLVSLASGLVTRVLN